jgi:glycosyltransferase involved in cell wall biosynthesis|tara:strand:- start:403 stop:1239 length:837 start_codon:yes stop_codon:yes gene_type:complete
LIFTEDYPKISVVTPNFNQGDYIEQTIQSVLNQNYPNLEYIIIDGGSTDNSLEIIKKYQDKLSYWVSESDAGMYDAINKGFSRSTGEIMCWINSDDVLWHNSLDNVASIFKSNEKVEWLQGYPSVIDEKGKLILQRDAVFSKFYFYLNNHKESFSFIQQESTFWSRNLWNKTGGYLNLDYKLASDFDLWMRFFQFKKMYCTKKQLAAFRKRDGQKSSNTDAYLDEVNNSLENNHKILNLMDKIKIKSLKILNIGSKNRLFRKIIIKVSILLIGKPNMV